MEYCVCNAHIIMDSFEALFYTSIIIFILISENKMVGMSLYMLLQRQNHGRCVNIEITFFM